MFSQLCHGEDYKVEIGHHGLQGNDHWKVTCTVLFSMFSLTESFTDSRDFAHIGAFCDVLPFM